MSDVNNLLIFESKKSWKLLAWSNFPRLKWSPPGSTPPLKRGRVWGGVGLNTPNSSHNLSLTIIESKPPEQTATDRHPTVKRGKTTTSINHEKLPRSDIWPKLDRTRWQRARDSLIIDVRSFNKWIFSTLGWERFCARDSHQAIELITVTHISSSGASRLTTSDLQSTSTTW